MSLYNFRKTLHLIVPREVGRFIYFSLFKIEKMLIKRKFKQGILLWYRNSLYQSYFAFGLSDIDLSAELPGNQSLPKLSGEILNQALHCPLIKEINFYYPYSLNVLPSFANFFEISKDPILLQKTGIKKPEYLNLEAQKLTYLLRMFFANYSHIKFEFSKRDIEKWHFHFKLVDIKMDFNTLSKLKDGHELLGEICQAFPLLEKSSRAALTDILNAYHAEKPMHILLQESTNPGELLALMPHLFCFITLATSDFLDFSEKVFIEQIAWEIQGMLSQPTLFTPGSFSFTHLSNIESVLTQENLHDDFCKKQKIILLKILEDYREMLSASDLIVAKF